MRKAHHGDRDRPGTVSRRQFIQGVVATSATAGIVAAAPAAAAALPVEAQVAILTPAQRSALTRVANRLVPSEGAMPAAGDLGVVAYIDKALIVAPHLRGPILNVLAALPDPDTFEQMSESDLDGLLHTLEREQRESFDILLEATYGGYYSHPRVKAALGWNDFEQLPDPWESFDTALLDGMRNRGAMREDV